MTPMVASSAAPGTVSRFAPRPLAQSPYQTNFPGAAITLGHKPVAPVPGERDDGMASQAYPAATEPRSLSPLRGRPGAADAPSLAAGSGNPLTGSRSSPNPLTGTGNPLLDKGTKLDPMWDGLSIPELEERVVVLTRNEDWENACDASVALSQKRKQLHEEK